MTETLKHGYSSKGTQRELSSEYHEYQHDRVWMVFRNRRMVVLWTKVASALEGLINILSISPSYVFSKGT